MIVALIGLSISFFAYFIAFPNPQQRRFDVYLLVLVFHLAATIAYWLLSFEEAMDAFTYYRDPYGFVRMSPFEEGTYFVVHFVQLIRNTLGGSFLDHFLFFQSFGMVGIALLARCINEMAESLQVPVPLHVYGLLLFPGMHFWSVAIGKDAPLMMAICLALWSSMRIDRRLVWMAIALAIMGLIRPHVAAIAVVALAGSLFLTRSLSLKYKITLGPIALLAMVYLAFLGLRRLGVEGPDLSSITEFIEYQQNLGKDYGSGADIQSMSFPLKVITLLFRPFWVDAPGMLGLVASAENTILVAVFGYILFRLKTLARLCRNVAYMTYSVIFSALMIILLSLVNYNIGLGQRQKMMAIPTLLIIVATIYMYRRYFGSASQAAATPAAQAAPDTVQASSAGA